MKKRLLVLAGVGWVAYSYWRFYSMPWLRKGA